MKNIFYLTVLICFSLILQSCSADEEVATTTPSQTMTDSTGASVSLDGTYLAACKADSDNESDKATFTISGTSMSFLRQGYTDDKCTTSKFDYKVVNTFSPGASTTASTGETVTKNTMTSVSQDLTITAETMLTNYNGTVWNSTGMYGFRDWVSGTERDITGLLWTGGENPVNVLGAVWYDLLYISGTSLQMGSTTDNNSTYPTELDNSSIYVKQ